MKSTASRAFFKVSRVLLLFFHEQSLHNSCLIFKIIARSIVILTTIILIAIKPENPKAPKPITLKSPKT